MTDRVKNQPGPSTIVKNTQLWPTSFTKPEKQTRVCIRTYIFKDSTKVQKFLDFLKEKFPNRNVDVKQLDNGDMSITAVNNTTPTYKCCKSLLYKEEQKKYTCCLESPDGDRYWGCCFSIGFWSSKGWNCLTPNTSSSKNSRIVSNKCSISSS